MPNIKPSAIEIALTKGELSKEHAKVLSLLCRKNPGLEFVENAFTVNGNTLKALERRGFLETRTDPTRTGYFFTEKTVKLWESQLKAEGSEVKKRPKKKLKPKHK
jgi:hypothetical protein